MSKTEERLILVVAAAAVFVGLLGAAAVILFRQPGPFPRPFVIPKATTTSFATTSSTSISPVGSLPRSVPA